MLFNSQIFVFVFMPLVVLCYYGAHKLGVHRGALVVLFLASLLFYGYYNPVYVLLLLGSIAFNYGIYCLFRRPVFGVAQRRGARKLLLAVGILVNLSLLIYFKYCDFFIQNINGVFGSKLPLLRVALPLGISFFTFQQISFVVDAYRGEVGQYKLLEYGVFVSFFPQLVAGPIVTHDQLIPQLTDERRWHIDARRFTDGMRYFVMGLFKKTIVADHFGNMVELGYARPIQWNAPGAALVVLAYTLQIYFDFSGYSDMAIGLGQMLGIDLPVNFDMPYKATDIGVFWKRWHMTMTSFFTKYLYIPLGGSRRGLWRTCLNTLIVFALSGLWHGAGWNFCLWGVLHGVALVGHRLGKKYIRRLPGIVTGAVTFVFVNLAWVFFRAESMQDALQLLRCLVRGGWRGSFEGIVALAEAFFGDSFGNMLGIFTSSQESVRLVTVAVMLVTVMITLAAVFLAPSSHQICRRKTVSGIEGCLWGFLAVICILTFNRVSAFLYFNF